MLTGDYLESFIEPIAPPEAVPDGQPDYDKPAELVMADERRQSAYPGMLMLIDRGQDQDVRAGQRLTIFRQTIERPRAGAERRLRNRPQRAPADVAGPCRQLA